MATFLIRTIDSSGVPHEEKRDATDQGAIYNDFKSSDTTLVSIVEQKANRTQISIPMPWNRIHMSDKINFSRNLGSMTEAGLSVSRALAVIQRQTHSLKFKAVVGELITRISAGRSLSESMSEFPKVFPGLMVSMVRSGEESGSIAQSLRTVATQMENSYNLTRKIRGALMYPSIVVTAMIGIGFFMLIYVVPTLAATFKSFNTALPIQTEAIIDASAFFQANWLLVIIILVILIGSIWGTARTTSGKRWIETALLHFPVIGPLTKEINAARTARTFSSLLSAGVDFLVATKITGDVLQNTHYKDILKLVEQKVEKGESIAAVFSANEFLYPPFVGEMVAVGEETGELSKMFLNIAVYYETDVDQKTKDMASIIEPFLMILIGLAVGFFAVSMISPIYSLSSAIS